MYAISISRKINAELECNTSLHLPKRSFKSGVKFWPIIKCKRPLKKKIKKSLIWNSIVVITASLVNS